MGIPAHDAHAMAMDAALRVDEWVTQMNLPTRLPDVGVNENDIPKLAALAFQNKTVQNNPKPIPNIENLENFPPRRVVTTQSDRKQRTLGRLTAIKRSLFRVLNSPSPSYAPSQKSAATRSRPRHPVKTPRDSS